MIMMNLHLIMVAVEEAVVVVEEKFSVKCVSRMVTQLQFAIIGLMLSMCLDLPHNLLMKVNKVHGGLHSHLGNSLHLNGSNLLHLGSNLHLFLHGNLLLFLSSGDRKSTR